MHLWIVFVGWAFVVLLMALAEATSARGSVLGALLTLLLYGVLPLGVLMYILSWPMRRRARQAREQAASDTPDASSLATGDAVAPEREER